MEIVFTDQAVKDIEYWKGMKNKAFLQRFLNHPPLVEKSLLLFQQPYCKVHNQIHILLSAWC